MGGPERKGGSSTSPPPNATQRHPTPARLWWSLRPCQRVKQRLLARNLFSASATLRQPVSPRQPSGPNMELARSLKLCQPSRPQRGAGTEPKNRSRAHHSTDSRRMQNWCELLFSGSYSWKNLGQSGWLSNKKPISRNSCLSPPAQAFDNNFLFKSLITCVHL